MDTAVVARKRLPCERPREGRGSARTCATTVPSDACSFDDLDRRPRGRLSAPKRSVSSSCSCSTFQPRPRPSGPERGGRRIFWPGVAAFREERHLRSSCASSYGHRATGDRPAHGPVPVSSRRRDRAADAAISSATAGLFVTVMFSPSPRWRDRRVLRSAMRRAASERHSRRSATDAAGLARGWRLRLAPNPGYASRLPTSAACSPTSWGQPVEQPTRTHRLRPVADRVLGVLVDLDDDAVGADSRRRPRGGGSTRRRSPEAWLGSTITGRWLWSFSHGTAPRSSVKRVAVSKVRMPRLRTA